MRRALFAALAGAALAACGGPVVQAGPGAAAGKGFTDVVVTTTATTAAPSSSGPTTAPSGPTRLDVGDCLTSGSGANASSVTVVACTTAHTEEVAGSIDLSDLFAADAAYPSADQLSAAGDRCQDVVTKYLSNSTVDPATLQFVVITPEESAWEQGDRTAWCAIGLVAPDGSDRASTGRIADSTAR